MKIADDRLNPQVLELEEAETEIRQLIIRSFITRIPKVVIGKRLKEIIEKAVAQIRSEELKEAARKSLMQFAEKQYETLQTNLGGTVFLLGIIIGFKNSPSMRDKRVEEFVSELIRKYPDIPAPRGIQKDYYLESVIKRVDSVFEELTKQQALDPDDISGRNNLRNKAEMEIRYQRHEEEKNEMKQKGGLWVCSVHADCSKRCFPWQGKIYSMDGTSGITSDGKEYIPLEKATNIYYTTRAGKTYKNGLLGFNCRHELTPYKPNMQIPTVSRQEQQKQYGITLKQRQYENEIRKAKIESVTYEMIDPHRSAQSNKRAKTLYKKYRSFSRKNNRAFYPDRTKIR